MKEVAQGQNKKKKNTQQVTAPEKDTEGIAERIIDLINARGVVIITTPPPTPEKQITSPT